MQLNTIEIWSPKYSTDEVLIDPKKVASHNKIVFTKSNSLKDSQYYISGQLIKSYPLVSNGSIQVHAVPMSKLELIATPENVKQKEMGK